MRPLIEHLEACFRRGAGLFGRRDPRTLL